VLRRERVRTVAVPYECVVAPEGRREGAAAVAVADGKLLVAHAVHHNDGSPAPLDVVDPNTGAVLNTIPVGINTRAVTVASEARRAFAANFDSADISVIDLNTLVETATIPLPINPISIAYLRGRVYVTGTVPRSQDVGLLIAIDPTTLVASAPIPLGRGPADIGLSHDSLVITNEFDYNIEFVNLNTGQAGITLATSILPTGLAVDPLSGKIYVANQDSPGSISVFCPAQSAPIAAALHIDPVSVQAGGLAVVTLDLTDAAPPGLSATLSSSALINGGSNATVASGGSATSFVTRADPSSAGNSSPVTGDANGTNQQVLLTVTPMSSPSVVLSSSAVLFDSIPVGTTSAPQTITMTNAGTADLVIDAV